MVSLSMAFPWIRLSSQATRPPRARHASDWWFLRPRSSPGTELNEVGKKLYLQFFWGVVYVYVYIYMYIYICHVKKETLRIRWKYLYFIVTIKFPKSDSWHWCPWHERCPINLCTPLAFSNCSSRPGMPIWVNNWAKIPPSSWKTCVGVIVFMKNSIYICWGR